jgi:hypothetical protein
MRRSDTQRPATACEWLSKPLVEYSNRAHIFEGADRN